MTPRKPDARFEPFTPREIREEAYRLAVAFGAMDAADRIRKIPLVKVRPL